MQCSYLAYRRVLTSYESNTGIVHQLKETERVACSARVISEFGLESAGGPAGSSLFLTTSWIQSSNACT